MSDRLTNIFEEFFTQKWELINSVILTFDQKPQIETNSDESRITAQIEIPLAYAPSKTQLKEDIGSSPSGMHDIYIEMHFSFDRTNQHLAVVKSSYQIRVASHPVVRFEYDKAKTNAPCAHIHIHATTLLAPSLIVNFKNRNKKAGSRTGVLDDLHIPVGGHRYRPSLEEFLYFVIGECGFHGKEGWQQHLLNGLNSWRKIQCEAAVRDHPDAAVKALQNLGYEITKTCKTETSLGPHEGW